MKIIERTDEEYMQEIYNLYENEVKPLIEEGYSLTRIFKKLGVHTGTTTRKAKELKKLALADGYEMRR